MSPLYRICALVFGAFLVAPAAFAESSSAMFPENAHAKSYGTGWECNPGYRQVENSCAALEVPANAFPTNASYGAGWECKRGYQEISGTCTMINVPAHGHLNVYGDGWD